MQKQDALTSNASDRHTLLLRRGHGNKELVPVADIFLLVGLLRACQAQYVVMGSMMMIMVVVIMMMALPFTPVLLGLGPALSELARHASSSGTEQQRVHDGTGHQLDDPRWRHFLLAGAGWTLGVVAVRSRGRHGQWVQVLGKVVVAVRQLRGHRLDVLG